MPMTDNDTDTKSLHGPNLILDVENFGPIAEAKNIEFRPMTVFVGPSNTGKSYLALLLHAILKAKNGDLLRPDAVPPTASHFVGALDRNRRDEFLSEIRMFVGTEDVRHSTVMPFDRMSEKMQSFMSSATTDWLDTLAERSMIETERYFQRGLSGLVTSNSAYKKLSINAYSGAREWLMSLTSDMEYETATNRRVDLTIDSTFSFVLRRFNGNTSNWRSRVESNFVDATDRSIARNMNPFVHSHYAPAGRTGIVNSRAVLTEAIIAHWQNSNFGRMEVGQLKPIVGEFLRSLARRTSTTDARDRRTATPSRGLARLAGAIERTLLGGKIVESEVEFDDGTYVYETKSFRGPLHLASSMVTEIAPLVLTIRNRVRRGELLIIDEPEAHLHPEAQQMMAAMLAYCIRQNVRVLITTHSHYFVEQLGALVNAGADSVDPDQRQRHLGLLGRDIDRNLYLRQDEVAVYEFEPRDNFGSPSKVTELEFDGDYLGYYPFGYSKALAEQRNRNINMIGAREGF